MYASLKNRQKFMLHDMFLITSLSVSESSCGTLKGLSSRFKMVKKTVPLKRYFYGGSRQGFFFLSFEPKSYFPQTVSVAKIETNWPFHLIPSKKLLAL